MTWKCLISRSLKDMNTRQRLSFSFPALRYTDSPLKFNPRKICQRLTNWTRWNKRDKVWNSANLKWRFRSRRRSCCLYTLHRVVHFSPLSTREWCLIDIFVDNLQSGLVHEDKYIHCKSENLFLYTLSIRKICFSPKNWAISMSNAICLVYFGSFNPAGPTVQLQCTVEPLSTDTSLLRTVSNVPTKL